MIYFGKQSKRLARVLLAAGDPQPSGRAGTTAPRSLGMRG